MTKHGRTISSLALMALGGLWTLNGLAALLMLLAARWSATPIDTTDATGIAAVAGTTVGLVVTFLLGLAGLLPLWFGYRLWQKRNIDTPLFGRNGE
jgi:hypothetical protein